MCLPALKFARVLGLLSTLLRALLLLNLVSTGRLPSLLVPTQTIALVACLRGRRGVAMLAAGWLGACVASVAPTAIPRRMHRISSDLRS